MDGHVVLTSMHPMYVRHGLIAYLCTNRVYEIYLRFYVRLRDDQVGPLVDWFRVRSAVVASAKHSFEQRTSRLRELRDPDMEERPHVERLEMKSKSEVSAEHPESMDHLEHILWKRTDRIQELTITNTRKRQRIENLEIKMESSTGAQDTDSINRV